MNDGTLSITRAKPLRQPSAAARRIAIRTPIRPRSLSLRLLATSSATAIAEAPMTPGADRSIEPIISTNVMPQVTTARTAAVSMMFCTLPNVLKSRAEHREDQEDDDESIGGTGVPEGHPPPRLGARRGDVDVLGGGCQGHEIGPCERLKTLSHSKSAGSVFGVANSATLSSWIRNCSANQAGRRRRCRRPTARRWRRSSRWPGRCRPATGRRWRRSRSCCRRRWP